MENTDIRLRAAALIIENGKLLVAKEDDIKA